MPPRKGRRAEPPDATLPSLTDDQIAQVERAYIRMPSATAKTIAATTVPRASTQAVKAHLAVEAVRLDGLRRAYQVARLGEMRTLAAEMEAEGGEDGAARALTRRHLLRSLALTAIALVGDAEQATTPAERARLVRCISDAMNALARADEDIESREGDLPPALLSVLQGMSVRVAERKDAEIAAAADTAGDPTGEPPLPPRDDRGAA
jgi:hypothetical protein